MKTLSKPTPGPIQQTQLLDARGHPPSPSTHTELSCLWVPRSRHSCQPHCTACPPGCGHAHGEGHCASPGPPRSGPSQCSCRSAGRKEMTVRCNIPRACRTLQIPAVPLHSHHSSCCSCCLPPAPADMQSSIHRSRPSFKAPSWCSHTPAKDTPLLRTALTLTVG